jgi:hypothetical protein
MFTYILEHMWTVNDRYFRCDFDETPIFNGDAEAYKLYLQTVASEIRKDGLMEHLGANQYRMCSEPERNMVCRAFGKLYFDSVILNTHGWVTIPNTIRLDGKSKSEELYDQAIALGLKFSPNDRTRYIGVAEVAKEMGMDRQALTYHLNKVHPKREDERRGGATMNLFPR